jgi:hypothetical protein
MKKKRKAPPSSGRKLSGAAMAAAAIPLAVSLLPSALDRATNKGPGATAPAPVVFKTKCELPFDDIKTEGLTVDAKCGLDGSAAANDVKTRLEMNVKNNFCAEGSANPITYDDLKDLQKLSDSQGLKQKLKTSRTSLTNIFKSAAGNQVGEGSLVQLVAFVEHAKNSNKGTGEVVNCKLKAVEENDIHIELTIDKDDDDPCNSVTAEMSPHFRPEAWDDLVNLKLERPVRITGQLFFDSSHAPCHDDVRPTPNRISTWEIHPVYQFEVCKAKEKTLAACDVKNNSLWVPLDQWNNPRDEGEP